MRGKLIVFEGIDGCGKTTQLGWIKSWMMVQGISPLTSEEPGGSDMGRYLRRTILSKDFKEPITEISELLLYAADRAQHVAVRLRPFLQMGAIVLCSRFTESTLAYQGYGRGLDMSMIQYLNNLASGGIQSDLTIWLDVDTEIGLGRVRKTGPGDRIEQEKLDFFERVREGYLALHQADPERVVRVDANRAETRVALDIQEIIEKKILQEG